MIDRNIAQAQGIGRALADIGYTLPVPVFLNQIPARASDDARTKKICAFVQASGAG